MAARKKKPADETSSEPVAEATSEEKPKTRSKRAEALDPFDELGLAMEKKWPGQVSLACDLSQDGIPRISTGNIALDIATWGGIPRGRISRFWGQPKSAKTGSAFNVVAEFQKHCSICFERKACKCLNRRPAGALWIDAEGRSGDNMPWMLAHGIDPSRCLITQPTSGEAVVDSADAALRRGIGLIVIDSIANIVSSAELNKATEDGGVIGRNAALINSALRKWQASINAAGLTSTRKPTILLLNQIRNKTDGYGNPDVMPGGKGQDYATSCDVKFTRRAFHYITNEGTPEEPKWKDNQAGGGAKGYKHEGDDTPDYVEVEYLMTSGNAGGQNRSGVFNYWLRNTHGHHPGDTDNAEQLFTIAKTEGWLVKEGSGYTFKGLEGRTQEIIHDLYMADQALQARLWDEILAIKTKL